MSSAKTKYCYLKSCYNTSVTCPRKKFFTVPLGNKAEWCVAGGWDYVPNYGIFICEDHLDLEEDLENYMYWKTMNVNARLKPRVPIFKHPFEKIYIVDLPGTSQSAQTEIATQSSIGVMSCSQISTGQAQVKPQMADKPSVSLLRVKTTKEVNFVVKPTENRSPSPLESTTAEAAEEEVAEVDSFTDTIVVEPTENQSPSPLESTTAEAAEEEVAEVDSFTDTITPGQKSSYIGRKFMLSIIENRPMAYIGVPKQYYWIIAYLASTIKTVNALSIILTLYKLRSNDRFLKISDLFELSRPTLWRSYYQTLNILSEFFNQFIYWPPMLDIKRNLPNAFKIHKDFSQVQGIIYCFEVEIEKPSNPIERSLTWSQYKTCNTAKFLISSTPNGFINFISKGYGGRISDVNLVEQCGFMDVVPQNCTILADPGFKHLKGILSKKGVKLVCLPSVTTNMKKTKQEVIQAKAIASLRVHIKRVISRVLMFRILKPHSVVNNKLAKTLDDAVVVACGLVNLQSSMIKKT